MIFISGVQQSDSVIYTYIYFFQILSPCRLLQNIELSSLYDTLGPCWLSMLYIVVCIFPLYFLFFWILNHETAVLKKLVEFLKTFFFFFKGRNLPLAHLVSLYHFFFFCRTAWPNPCLLQWNHRALTTGPPRKSLSLLFVCVTV